VKTELRTKTRHDLLSALATGLAQDAGRSEAFQSSKAWPGYQDAFASWGQAFWIWVDAQVKPGTEQAWRAKLLENRGRFSPAIDYTVHARDEHLEQYLQTYLVRRAYFMGGLRHRRDTDYAWFKGFGFYFFIAQLIDDDTIFEALARLTTRKPSRDAGKRSLRFWLLIQWIPACYWAMMNNFIQTDLVWPDSSQSSGRTPEYSEGRIKNAISELRLWRPPKPLYWGFDRKGQIVPR
jgi:hypothetical protein